MKRRDFLKGVAAVPVVAAVPLQEPPVRSVGKWQWKRYQNSVYVQSTGSGELHFEEQTFPGGPWKTFYPKVIK